MTEIDKTVRRRLIQAMTGEEVVKNLHLNQSTDISAYSPQGSNLTQMAPCGISGMSPHDTIQQIASSSESFLSPAEHGYRFTPHVSSTPQSHLTQGGLGGGSGAADACRSGGSGVLDLKIDQVLQHQQIIIAENGKLKDQVDSLNSKVDEMKRTIAEEKENEPTKKRRRTSKKLDSILPSTTRNIYTSYSDDHKFKFVTADGNGKERKESVHNRTCLDKLMTDVTASFTQQIGDEVVCKYTKSDIKQAVDNVYDYQRRQSRMPADKKADVAKRNRVSTRRERLHDRRMKGARTAEQKALMGRIPSALMSDEESDGEDVLVYKKVPFRKPDVNRILYEIDALIMSGEGGSVTMNKKRIVLPHDQYTKRKLTIRVADDLVLPSAY